MSLIDDYAAQRVRELREERGMSPEALATDIHIAARNASWGRRGAVNAHTIRRIEGGHVPGLRVRFVIASYFGLAMGDLWPRSRQRRSV